MCIDAMEIIASGRKGLIHGRSSDCKGFVFYLQFRKDGSGSICDRVLPGDAMACSSRARSLMQCYDDLVSSAHAMQ